MKVYTPRDIRPFVMYCVNGKPRSSLLIESTDSMTTDSMIINVPQAIDRGEGRGTAEVNGAEPSAMVVEKDVVRPSAMVVESDSVGASPMVTEVGRNAQSSRPDGQLSQHF